MSQRLTLRQLADMDRSAFVEALGGVYEHSPWVAELTWPQRPFDSRDQLAQAMANVVREAGIDKQLALLREHPRLGEKGNLTKYSQREQTGAGIQDAVTADRASLARLNEAYQAKFGFPFVIAVRGLDLPAIIDRCRARIEADKDAEFAESLEQVHRIAALRLAELIES